MLWNMAGVPAPLAPRKERGHSVSPTTPNNTCGKNCSNHGQRPHPQHQQHPRQHHQRRQHHQKQRQHPKGINTNRTSAIITDSATLCGVYSQLRQCAICLLLHKTKPQFIISFTPPVKTTDSPTEKKKIDRGNYCTLRIDWTLHRSATSIKRGKLVDRRHTRLSFSTKKSAPLTRPSLPTSTAPSPVKEQTQINNCIAYLNLRLARNIGSSCVLLLGRQPDRTLLYREACGSSWRGTDCIRQATSQVFTPKGFVRAI